ncbi:YncE family protein [Streptomyces sp. NPDC033754]|uniref:YncE family protein n=1 Tax=unclassified Streptomyces TaxID=2593676 RepID=UPI0033E28CE0
MVALAIATALVAPASASAAPPPPKPHPSVYAYVTSDGGEVHAIDTSTNTVNPLGTFSIGGGPDQVAVTPDGATLYVSNAFKVVSVIDIVNKSIIKTIKFEQKDPPDILFGMAMAPDGKRVYVAVQHAFGGDKVSVIDTASKEITGAISVSTPEQVAVSSNSKRVYVGGKGGVSVINAVTDKVIDTISLDERPYAMALTPNDKRAYVTAFSGHVSVINIAKRKVARTIPDAGPLGLAISPDGKRAYATGVDTHLEQGRVSVIDTATDKVIATVLIGERRPSGPFFRPTHVAITPDGKRAYVTGSYEGKGSKSGTVFAIDTTTNEATPITVGTGETRGVAIGQLGGKGGKGGKEGKGGKGGKP